MGVYLGLEILPLQIDAGEWNGFYEQALELARVFPLPLQRFTAEEKFGHYRVLLTRNLESQDRNGRFFAIIGDARTKQRGGQFMLYRDIDFYRRRVYERPPQKTGQGCQTAQLSHILFRNHDSVGVFNEKTHSCPYHDLIWCIVTLAENLFPGRACAEGNLDAREWGYCLQWLAGIQGKPMRKPLRLDSERLWDILSQGYGGLELVQKTEEKLRGEKAAIYRLLAAKDARLFNSWAKKRLKENHHDITGALSECFYILEGTGNLYALVRMACLDPDGPRWDLERVLSIACALGAFDPKPARTVRASGFFPAGFLPWYYRTGAYFEKKEASRRLAGMVGMAAEAVEKILRKLQAECPPPVTSRKADHSEDDNRPRTMAIAYPEGNVDFIRQEIARRGRNWDGPTLRGLIAPMASQKHVVLTEETWQVIDREQDPAVLAGILGLMVCYEAVGNAGLETVLNCLPEIMEAWASGRAWTCPEGELTFDHGAWWAQPQISAADMA